MRQSAENIIRLTTYIRRDLHFLLLAVCLTACASTQSPVINTKNSDAPISDRPLTPVAGTLVFAAKQDSHRELFAVHTDGSGLRQLTSNSMENYSPKWSPDGQRVTYVSSVTGNQDIFILALDGSLPMRLTKDPASDVDPAWSPDGTKIVFASRQQSANYELYFIDLIQRTMERITISNTNNRHPDWSPDGKQILYQAESDSRTDIFMYNWTSRRATRVTFAAQGQVIHPCWAPDGQRYLSEKLIDTGGSLISVRGLTTSTPFDLVTGYLSWPVWSPDGSQVALVSYLAGQRDIFILSADGKSIFRVTHDDRIEGMVDWTAE